MTGLPSLLAALGLVGVVFALLSFLLVLFRYTPDTRVAWKSVWLAAAVTAPMLAIAAWGYGVYLGTVGFGSASGVAGTLLLGLAFVYYSAQMLLYGVEITKATYARSRDEHSDRR